MIDKTKLKLCVDCVHHYVEEGGIEDIHYCIRPQLEEVVSIDKVTGKVTHGCKCNEEREWTDMEGKCCEEGRFFKRKKNQGGSEVNDAMWKEKMKFLLQSLKAGKVTWEIYEDSKKQISGDGNKGKTENAKESKKQDL